MHTPFSLADLPHEILDLIIGYIDEHKESKNPVTNVIPDQRYWALLEHDDGTIYSLTHEETFEFYGW